MHKDKKLAAGVLVPAHLPSGKLVYPGGKRADDIMQSFPGLLVQEHFLRETFHFFLLPIIRARRNEQDTCQDELRERGCRAPALTFIYKGPWEYDEPRETACGAGGSYSARRGENVSTTVFFTVSRVPVMSKPAAWRCPPPPKDAAMAPTSWVELERTPTENAPSVSSLTSATTTLPLIVCSRRYSSSSPRWATDIRSRSAIVCQVRSSRSSQWLSTRSSISARSFLPSSSRLPYTIMYTSAVEVPFSTSRATERKVSALFCPRCRKNPVSVHRPNNRSLPVSALRVTPMSSKSWSTSIV